MASGRCGDDEARCLARPEPGWRRDSLTTLLDHRQGIERYPLPADFEVKMGSGRSTRGPRESDHLARRHGVSPHNQPAREVAVHRLIPVRMLEQNEPAILGVL